MSDLDFQQLSTVQSKAQLTPTRVVAAATIAPTTFLTVVSGTTSIAQITPFVTGSHMIALAFSDADPGDLLTTGNVLIGLTSITTNRPVLLVYDPVQAKYLIVHT